MEYLKEQHGELMERIVKSHEDLSVGVNKLVDKVDDVASTVSDLKVKVGKLETKLEG